MNFKRQYNIRIFRKNVLQRQRQFLAVEQATHKTSSVEPVCVAFVRFRVSDLWVALGRTYSKWVATIEP